MRRLLCVAVLGAIIGCDDHSSDKPAVLPTPSAPTAQTTGDANGPSAAAPSAPTAPGATANTPSDAGITWTLPQGWTQREGSQMRIATLVSNTAVEVSVTGFGGLAGGTLANVNRWRGQLELPPITDADIPSNTQKFPTAAGEAMVVDISGAGAEPQRLIAAIVPGPGKTFFFKMTGPGKRLEEAKPGFLALLKTVKPDAAQ